MGFLIDQYQGFSGNAIDLANVANQCARFLQMPGDLEKINERLIRYYVTEGLVDRPKRIGRDAQYGYSHLLQFLASRFLVESGFPMQKVAPYMATLVTNQVEMLVMNKAKPSMAELLVASFQNGRRGIREERIHPANPKMDLNDAFSFREQAKHMEKRGHQENVVFSMRSTRDKEISDGNLDCRDALIEANKQICVMVSTVKEHLSVQGKRQTASIKDAMNAVAIQLERMRMEMTHERSRWREQMEEERKEQRELLNEQNVLIKALLEAQVKGKQNG